MKILLQLVWGIAVSFYYTFFIYKLYQWYSPHLPAELLEVLPSSISYLEMYALSSLLLIIRGMTTTMSLAKLSNRFSEQYGTKEGEWVYMPIAITLMLGMSYLMELILW